MRMTKQLWRALDFEWSAEGKCWWSPSTQESFTGRKTLRQVVDRLREYERNQAHWMGKNEVRKAIRAALGINGFV